MAAIPRIISTVVTTSLYILGLSIIGGIGWFVLYLQKFNKVVILRDIVNGRVIIKQDKAAEIKDKTNKVTYWKLLKEKDPIKKRMPVPPSTAIDITTKGTMFVETYRTQNGHYAFIKDKGAVAEIPKNMYKDVPQEIENIEDLEEKSHALQAWKTKTKEDWMKEHNVQEAFEPLTTDQRVLLIKNIQDAEERKTNSIWSNLPQLAAIASVVIIVVSLLVFYADIAEPVITARQIGENELKIQQSISETQKEIMYGIQTINAENKEIKNQLNQINKPPN